MGAIEKLAETIEARKESSAEQSYTRYLFEKGLDKILKKIGEESAETIIAAKEYRFNPTDKTRADIVGEVCDLAYHVLVMTAELDIPLNLLEEELEKRAEKSGNLKTIKSVDKDS
ncbi:phosphoribosyl-ATP pyrophosphatase [Clostridia bacterium]|nr:phosphoribosyl-ATP pyrophosphatase [Clostridia bacterium]